MSSSDGPCAKNTINNHFYSDRIFSDQLLMECLQRWTFSSCQAYTVPQSCGAFLTVCGSKVFVVRSRSTLLVNWFGRDAAVKNSSSSIGHGHPEDSGQWRQRKSRRLRGIGVFLVKFCFIHCFALLEFRFMAECATTQVSILTKRSSEKGEAPRRLARCEKFLQRNDCIL